MMKLLHVRTTVGGFETTIHGLMRRSDQRRVFLSQSSSSALSRFPGSYRHLHRHPVGMVVLHLRLVHSRLLAEVSRSGLPSCYSLVSPSEPIDRPLPPFGLQALPLRRLSRSRVSILHLELPLDLLLELS